jgi:probable rRNA maturation factor
LSPDLSDVEGDLRAAVDATLTAAGVEDGHIGLELVGEGKMRTLNYAHRGVDEATDVLAFPIDDPRETGSSSDYQTGGSSRSPLASAEDPRISPGPRELGDVFVCPEQASDVIEAAVHGTLHLCGYDHETDKGEMLALQAEILDSLR